MSLYELILTGEYFSPALMSMGWGPKGFLGSHGPYVVGFQTMVIMDLWDMAYHAVVVIAPIYILLFNSTSTCCALGTLSFFMTFSSNLVADKPK